jgi:hypothetical protein
VSCLKLGFTPAAVYTVKYATALPPETVGGLPIAARFVATQLAAIREDSSAPALS